MVIILIKLLLVDDEENTREGIYSVKMCIRDSINTLFTFVLLAVGPFNLFKGILTSILTVLLYKRVSNVLHKF